MSDKPQPATGTTDLDDWKALLSRFGVEIDEFDHPVDDGSHKLPWEARTPETAKVVQVKQHGDLVKGYGRFYFEAEFDAEGRFIRIGIWE